MQVQQMSLGTRLPDSVRNATAALLEYCEKEGWAGYDPYDCLNSRILRASPITKNKTLRLIATQAMKRSPINLRRLLMVPKSENPKACALFCSSLIRLTNIGFLPDDSLLTARLDRLMELRSEGYSQYCWGYNFDWQSRGFFLPRFVPNIICTTFGGTALLEAYEKYGEPRFLEAASSAGDFLTTELNVTYDGDGLCFSYTPLDRAQVHNANLLAAGFLARLWSLTGAKPFLEMATKAVRFSLTRQSSDGSWPYGEDRTQRWIDNFHTGYNLMALWRISQIISDVSVEEAIAKGFEFYVDHFFTDEGAPKYYHNRLWPVDVHSVAQSIVTLSELQQLHSSAPALADQVCQWALANMRNKRGYFHYQKTRFYENRIPYMRWSQAWMLYSLAVYLESVSDSRD